MSSVLIERTNFRGDVITSGFQTLAFHFRETESHALLATNGPLLSVFNHCEGQIKKTNRQQILYTISIDNLGTST